MRRASLSALFALLWVSAMAQFKLVPQSKLDSVANPRTVASVLIVEQKVIDLGRVVESEIAHHKIAIKNSGKTTIF